MTNKQRIRAFIFYEWLRGNRESRAAVNINDACKESVVSERTISRWSNRFNAGNMGLEDDERSGEPSTLDEAELRRCIKENPEASTRGLAASFRCNQSTVLRHLNSLG